MNRPVRIKLHFTTCFFFLLMILSSVANAQGNLILLQKRVVFEGSKSFDVLDYGNIGQDTATYVVSLLNERMREDGSFETITEPDSGQMFADDYLRFFPKRMILAPKESQKMKIQLINTQDLKPGEYRSHLFFRAENNESSVKNPEEKKDGISVSIKSVFGIAIPVIIRVGPSTTAVQITDLSFENPTDTSNFINFSIHRSGNFSSYGHLNVIYHDPNGNETEVGNVMGVAVYTPGSIRRCKIALRTSPGINYHKGKLIVRYSKPEEEKGLLLAESSLELH